MADGTVKIDILLDDGKVVKGVANIDKSLGGIGETGKKASLGIGKIVGALGLVFLAKKGIDLVTASLDGAINRYDTLNQFPKVLQMMGFDAEDTEEAIARLSDGIDGLPTTLDSVAKTAQNIAIMTGDLDGATETTLALNNAFLSSGSSSADAERGLQQYVQMLSKGEVDMQSWRTLQETMGVALNTLAKDFGFTGEAAQNDLYDALKSGEITFDEFNTKLIEASDAQGGFADMAGEASAGVKTSWQNMKTAVVKGLTDVIGAIDKAMGGTGEIGEVIDKMKGAFQTAFAWIVSNIPTVVETIKNIANVAKDVYAAIKPWLPLFLSVSAGMLVAVKAFQAFAKAKLIIEAIKLSMLALNTTMLANPMFWIIAAIVAAVALIYIYWEPISEFFIALWDAIKLAGLAIWVFLKEVWASTVQWFISVWTPIAEFFMVLWESVKLVVMIMWEGIRTFFTVIITAIVEFIKQYFNNLKQNVMTVFNAIKSTITTIWNGIKSVFNAVISFIVNFVKSRFNNLKNNVSSIFNSVRSTISSIWNRIKSAISSVVNSIRSTISSIFNSIRSTISSVMSSVRRTISSIWNGIKSTISGVVNSIKSTVSNIFNSLRGIVTGAFRKVSSAVRTGISKAYKAVTDKIKSFFNAGKNIVGAIADGIKGAIGKVTGAIGNVASKIRNFLPFSPAKEGALRDIMDTQIPQSIAKSIDKGKGTAVKAMAGLTDDLNQEITPDVGFSNSYRGLTANSLIGNMIPDNAASGGNLKSSGSKTSNDNRIVNIKVDAGNLDELQNVIELFTGLKQTNRAY